MSDRQDTIRSASLRQGEVLKKTLDSLVHATPLQTLTDTDEWTDLGTFYRRGGIFYHGASDAWYSMLDTLDYLQRNRTANPEFDSAVFTALPEWRIASGGGLRTVRHAVCGGGLSREGHCAGGDCRK